jgi:hypothetical protein
MPKFSKNAGNSITFFPQNVASFLGNFLKIALTMLLQTFFFRLANFRHQKKTDLSESRFS